jgi:hypothetical protein
MIMKPESHITFQTSVSTSQKTQCSSIMKTSQLYQFMEINWNNKTLICAPRAKCTLRWDVLYLPC